MSENYSVLGQPLRNYRGICQARRPRESIAAVQEQLCMLVSARSTKSSATARILSKNSTPTPRPCEMMEPDFLFPCCSHTMAMLQIWQSDRVICLRFSNCETTCITRSNFLDNRRGSGIWQKIQKLSGLLTPSILGGVA